MKEQLLKQVLEIKASVRAGDVVLGSKAWLSLFGSDVSNHQCHILLSSKVESPEVPTGFLTCRMGIDSFQNAPVTQTWDRTPGPGPAEA